MAKQSLWQRTPDWGKNLLFLAIVVWVLILVVAYAEEPNRTTNKTPQISENDKREAARSVLERNGYNVVDVGFTINQNGASIAFATMTHNNKNDIYEQIGAALGILHGAWPDADYYSLAIAEEQSSIVCAYILDSSTFELLRSGNMNPAALNSKMDVECY